MGGLSRDGGRIELKIILVILEHVILLRYDKLYAKSVEYVLLNCSEEYFLGLSDFSRNYEEKTEKF